MTIRGTQMQNDVLDVLVQHAKCLSAYDIRDALRPGNPKLAPMTIYRALDALIEKGKVHRLESRNAFVACQSAAHTQPVILSVCDACGAVEEAAAPNIFDAVGMIAAQTGFTPKRRVLEVTGECGTCTAHTEAAP